MRKSRNIAWGALAIMLLVLGACEITSVECDDACKTGWMDGGNIRDICADDSTVQCLVSKRFSSPDDSILSKPVILAIHGFTASTFEWSEFKNFADTIGKPTQALVSLILLGGHGRSIDTFQSSNWQDWGRPILEEYDSLVAKGYKNISLAGASTGGALLLQYLAQGAFSKRQAPNEFFFIDPIVIPTAKLLSLANLVGPILGNIPDKGNAEENKHWYVNRPEEDLRQLYELINRVKNQLEDGFELPRTTKAKVFKSTKDGSADPIGAILIYKGLREAGGNHIDVKMVNSRLHVFTRLANRSETPSAADSLLQKAVFEEMIARVKL
jgi:carboxylesterase